MTAPDDFDWEALADRYELLEHGIQCHHAMLRHVLDTMQERLPTAPENDELWWQCENLRLGLDRVLRDVDEVNESLGELFNRSAAKIKNNVRWREGPRYALVPKHD